MTNQLVGAGVLCEVPHLDTPVLVAADELSLIWVDHDIVYW